MHCVLWQASVPFTRPSRAPTVTSSQLVWHVSGQLLLNSPEVLAAHRRYSSIKCHTICSQLICMLWSAYNHVKCTRTSRVPTVVCSRLLLQWQGFTASTTQHAIQDGNCLIYSATPQGVLHALHQETHWAGTSAALPVHSVGKVAPVLSFNNATIT